MQALRRDQTEIIAFLVVLPLQVVEQVGILRRELMAVLVGADTLGKQEEQEIHHQQPQAKVTTVVLAERFHHLIHQAGEVAQAVPERLGIVEQEHQVLGAQEPHLVFQDRQ